MATISFSNGQKVDFSGNPTQQDVEDVATKMGIHSPTQPQESAPQKSFLGGIVSAVGNKMNQLGNNVIKNVTHPLNALSAAAPQNLGNLVQPSNNGTPTLNPTVAKDVVNTTAGFAGGDLADTVVPKINAIPKEIQQAATTRSEGIATRQAGKDAVKINEMISPKETSTQAKLAQSQGRIYPGKEPTLFQAGTADKVATSDKTFNATNTIRETIPNAANMKPSELHTAVSDKVSSIAQELKPQMQATPIKPETIQKINTDWGALKSSQLKNADTTQERELIQSWQNKFEERLQNSGNANHNDLWDTRKAYDDSIPQNVKQANSMSSDALQQKKELWLQNREILNNAINDNASGMGQTSQKAFSDMSNLYEAKNNLLSKAKVNDAQMSKVNQFLKNNPKAAAALGGATAYEILKHLGIPLP